MFIGQRAADLDIGKRKIVSKVILTRSNDIRFEAGDDSGDTLELSNPWATQSMADSILTEIQKSPRYTPFEATDALLDPAAEIGDTATLGGVYSEIVSMDLDLGVMSCADLSAPGVDEIEDEYPYKSAGNREAQRENRRIYSLIAKNDQEIRLVVEELSGEFTELKVTLDGVTVTDSSGTTLIKGSSIQTSTLFVNAANITGTLTANQINLTEAITFGDLNSEVQGEINTANETASQALELAQQNELPYYIKSTYIDSARIESPTIYAGEFYGNDFTVYPQSSGNGSFNIFGRYNDQLYQFLEIAYEGGSSITDFPRVTFDSPDGATAHWSFVTSYFRGNIDFSGATVTGLTLASQSEMQTRAAPSAPVLLSAEKGALKISVDGATWLLNADGLTKEGV